MAEEQGTPSSRGLVDFDVGPLRRFMAVFDSMPKEPQSFGEGESAKKSMRVTFNFRDLEVLETIEPYHFPVFSFNATESNRKKSKYGVFAESFNVVADSQLSPEQLDPSNPNFVPAKDRMDFKDAIGKRLGLVLADGEDGRPEPPMLYDGRVQEDKPTPAWTVYSIEGIGAVGQGADAAEVAKQLLDGKTLPQFNAEALKNTTIKNDTALLTSISLPVSAAGNFANALIAAGEFTKDTAGVYHRVVAA